MANRIASASFLVSILFLSGAIATTDFFFFLVLTWPGASCSKGSACCLPTRAAPELDFFVEGLYPYKKTRWWWWWSWWDEWDDLTNCSNRAPFDADKIKNLTVYMDSYWANISCPCSNSLYEWENAWTKYGSCSKMTQWEYFNKTLQLRSKLDLLIKLRNKDIWPSDNEVYNSTKVHDVINNAVGQQTATVCKKSTERGQPRVKPLVDYQLQEIWLCVDKDATKIIKCPTRPKSWQKSSCGSHLYYSTFTYEKMQKCRHSNPIELPTFLSE